jgi:4-amino-4-deoxychorismate lyase
MILVNGVEREAVSVRDRGFAYGDGVFRTLAAKGGISLHWTRHYAKLADDCVALGIRCPDEQVLRAEVMAVCAGKASACAVKIIVTRGVGRRGYSYTGTEVPTRVVLDTSIPANYQAYAHSGTKVRMCSIRLAQQPALAGVKHLNRIENVLARAEWSDINVAEGLMRDTQDHVIGGTMSNLFLVVRGSLHTPALSRCGVAGVTRARVIAAAARKGVDCEVRDISYEDVLSADEAFVVNSLVGVWPIHELEGRQWMPGVMTAQVQRWLDFEDQQELANAAAA